MASKRFYYRWTLNRGKTVEITLFIYIMPGKESILFDFEQQLG